MITETKKLTPVRKFFRIIAKGIGDVLKTAFLLVLIAVLIVVIVPSGYFAWRAGQPMEGSKYNGLTLYQYMDWRFDTYKANAAEYQAAYPDKRVAVDACYLSDLMYAIAIPYSEWLTLASIYPDTLLRYVQPRDLKYMPTGVVTWDNVHTVWWTTYEGMIYEREGGDPVVYCRLPQYPPTPEQLNAQEH